MNEEYNYIERRNQIKRNRFGGEKKQSFFLPKLNMLLAVGIMAVCADMMHLSVWESFKEKAVGFVSENADLSLIKQKIVSAAEGIGGITAEEKPVVTMDDELIEQMNELSEAYENTQKKTRSN